MTMPVMDFPEAWAYVRETDFREHDPKCSYRAASGGFLCDCFILWNEYDRRKEARNQSNPETVCLGRPQQTPRP